MKRNKWLNHPDLAVRILSLKREVNRPTIKLVTWNSKGENPKVDISKLAICLIIISALMLIYVLSK